MACCYSRSVLMAMYPETEGCKCCHFKRRRDRFLNRKKVPVEVVTTNTIPLPTDDVDELVSMIEGTHLTKSKSASEQAKCAKKLKKERQREKKRLEEEALKREEEERMRGIEEARIKAEEGAREEVLRKKREKKKKQRQNKKLSKSEWKGGCGGGPVSPVPPIPTTTPSLPLILHPLITSSSNTVEGDNPKSSGMVTIKRHPDTTVTISMKRETGGEDLLCTLVNGQVYTDLSGLGSKRNKEYVPLQSSIPTPTAMTKKKGKKGKKSESGTKVMSGSGTENGHGTYEHNLFHSDMNVSPVPPKRTSPPCLNPIIPNGPSTSIITNKKSFSLFSDLDLDSNDIDFSTLKLPSGITITKVNQPNPPQGGSTDNGDMPRPGVGHYNIDSNMIVMNPDCDEGDEEGYKSEDYLYYGKRPVSEFETVLSSKEKRKRSKANKGDDGEGNGSSERPASREQTPSITTNTPSRSNSKRGSDPGIKGPDLRRNTTTSSKTTERNGTKTEKNDRKGKKPASKEVGRNVKTSIPPLRLSPLIPVSTTSPNSMDSPIMSRPLPKITPMNQVKMADVVSGVHSKPDVTVVPDDIPPTTSTTTTTTTLRQECGMPYYLRQQDPATKQSIGSDGGDQGEGEQGGDYNLWSSTPRQVTPESEDQRYSPAHPNPDCSKSGVWKWPWAFDGDSGRLLPQPSTPFDRHTPSPISSTFNSIPFDYGPGQQQQQQQQVVMNCEQQVLTSTYHSAPPPPGLSRSYLNSQQCNQPYPPPPPPGIQHYSSQPFNPNNEFNNGTGNLGMTYQPTPLHSSRPIPLNNPNSSSFRNVINPTQFLLNGGINSLNFNSNQRPPPSSRPIDPSQPSQYTLF